MISYGKLHFACAPRVGVSWFVKACQLSGLGPAFLRDPEPRNGTFRVTLIRHPARWLESIYAARKIGWSSAFIGEFGSLGIDDGLDAFVWQYLHELPGEVGRLLLKFKADSILRIEDMPQAFIELASALGIDPVYFPTIERMGRTNVNPLVVEMSEILSERVVDAEKEMCCEYEYF